MSVVHRGRKRRVVYTAAVGLVATAALTIGVASSPATSKSTSATPCKPKGTLSYGIAGAGISALDPIALAFAGQLPLNSLLYNSLTEYTPDGRVVPDLATKWKHSADLRTWWFYLRRDVKYANGRAFTSADVVANILRTLDLKVPSLWRPAIKDIQSVRAITKYQVRFKLGSPSVILPEALVTVEMSDLTDISKLNTLGNGTGPYKLDNFVPDQSVTLVPNPRYYGPKACMAKIGFVREPDPTSMITDFNAGNLDVIWQAPLSALQTLQRNRNAYIVKPKSVSSAHVWDLDVQSPPFNNPIARQALSHAIDRETMVKAAFFGTATTSVANSLMSTTSPNYNKKLAPQKFDLALAKRLFDQAGVKPGTTFTFWALAGRRDEWITMAQILQKDLQKIGLDISIQRNDITTWLARFNPAGKRFPNTIVGDFYSLPPNPIAAFGYTVSNGCNCNWNNKTYDALLKKASATVDPVKRKAVYDQMQTLFAKELPIMVIAHQTNVVAAQNRVKGIWEDPAGTTRLAGAYKQG